MNRNWTFTSAVIVAALGLAALPAGAQGRERGGRPGGAGQSAGAPASRPAPRNEGVQRAEPRQAPRQAPQAQSRPSAPRASESRPSSPLPPAYRAYEGRQNTTPRELPRASENRPASPLPPAYRAYEGRQNTTPRELPRASENRPLPAAPPARADEGRQNRGQPPRPEEARQQYSGQRAVPRNYGQPGYQAPAPRSGGGGGYNDGRGYAQPRDGYRSQNYAGPRPPAWGPSYGNRAHYVRPYHSDVYVRPRYYAPYRPYYFGRAYYTFRPYWDIGFGLWVGYSVPYPYVYLGAYTPRVYGYDYYAGSGYTVTAGVSIYGGLSFEIEPSDADLFVDGEYVGSVGMFGREYEPLTLTPGEHRIAIQRAGYRPMEWDVTIEPGQVIPYRGRMERY